MSINPGQLYGIHQDIQKYLSKIDVLKTEFKGLHDQSVEAIRLKDESEARVNFLKDEEKRFENIVSGLKLKLSKRNKEYIDEQTKIDVARKNLAELKRDIGIENDNLKHLQEQVSGFVASNEALREDQKRILKQISVKQQEFSVLDIDVNKLRSQDTQLKTLIQKSEKELHRIENRKEEVLKESEEYRLSLDHYRDNLNVYTNRLNERFKDLGIKIKHYGEN